MKIINTELPGVVVIEPEIHRDHRGFFLETYNAEKYRAAGLPEVFVQDNHSRSMGHTLRGLHAQLKHPQGKLVRAIAGRIFDVAVDIRPDSPYFGRWVGVTLSSDSANQCYIPPGFAHGFYVLSQTAEVEYKCTDFYCPGDEINLRWDDPAIGISWPSTTPVLSTKDATGMLLADVARLLSRLQEAA
ncbi:MAG TPA: dTDP-4-dehydrorhamnose 3,5-epimerase [Pyrinomonadaceae bacterium]|nr:dTDP-4-dehydrorhamnose 3,5-epimerase [Pyrinomonadaceae bacterium]